MHARMRLFPEDCGRLNGWIWINGFTQAMQERWQEEDTSAVVVGNAMHRSWRGSLSASKVILSAHTLSRCASGHIPDTALSRSTWGPGMASMPMLFGNMGATVGVL